MRSLLGPGKLAARHAGGCRRASSSSAEKDPARRYPDGEALREDLQRVLDGEPVRAGPRARRSALAQAAAQQGAAAALLALVLAWACRASGRCSIAARRSRSRSRLRQPDRRLRARRLSGMLITSLEQSRRLPCSPAPACSICCTRSAAPRSSGSAKQRGARWPARRMRRRFCRSIRQFDDLYVNRSQDSWSRAPTGTLRPSRRKGRENLPCPLSSTRCPRRPGGSCATRQEREARRWRTSPPEPGAYQHYFRGDEPWTTSSSRAPPSTSARRSPLTATSRSPGTASPYARCGSTTDRGRGTHRARSPARGQASGEGARARARRARQRLRARARSVRPYKECVERWPEKECAFTLAT